MGIVGVDGRPLFKMWGTGELRREIRPVKDSNGNYISCLVVRWKNRKEGAEPVVIPVNDMKLFYPKNQTEWAETPWPTHDGKRLTTLNALLICASKLLLPIESIAKESYFETADTLRRLCDYIQDGFDDLNKDRQYLGELEEKKAVGEYDLMIDGERVKTGELTERVG